MQLEVIISVLFINYTISENFSKWMNLKQNIKKTTNAN